MAGKSTRSKPPSAQRAEGETCHPEPLQPEEKGLFSQALDDLRAGRIGATQQIVDVWMADEALQKKHHLLRLLCQKQRGRRLLPPSDSLPPLP